MWRLRILPAGRVYFPRSPAAIKRQPVFPSLRSNPCSASTTNTLNCKQSLTFPVHVRSILFYRENCTISLPRPSQLNFLSYCHVHFKGASQFHSPSSICNKGSVSNSLFVYENNNTRPHYFIVISVMSVIQLLFWSYLALFAFTQEGAENAGGLEVSDEANAGVGSAAEPHGMDVQAGSVSSTSTVVTGTSHGQSNERTALSSLFASSKMRLGLSIFALGAGVLFAVTACMYPLRIVHKIFLLRSVGVAQAQLHTYNPLGGIRVLSTSLTDLTCSGDRLNANSMLTLKLKGYPMYFLVDSRGTFHAPHQFDRMIASRQRVL